MSRELSLIARERAPHRDLVCTCPSLHSFECTRSQGCGHGESGVWCMWRRWGGVGGGRRSYKGRRLKRKEGKARLTPLPKHTLQYRTLPRSSSPMARSSRSGASGTGHRVRAAFSRRHPIGRTPRPTSSTWTRSSSPISVPRERRIPFSIKIPTATVRACGDFELVDIPITHNSRRMRQRATVHAIFHHMYGYNSMTQWWLLALGAHAFSKDGINWTYSGVGRSRDCQSWRYLDHEHVGNSLSSRLFLAICGELDSVGK